MWYWLYRTDQHSLQAPLVFDLYQKVFRKRHIIDSDILNLWDSLKKSDQAIHQQYGAGSLIDSKEYSVFKIARYGVTSPKNASLIYQFISYFKSKNVLELGSSIGLHSAVLARNSYLDKLVTVDRQEDLIKIAKYNFEQLGIENIEVVHDDVFKYINNAEASAQKFDLIYVDADHSYSALMRYNDILPRILSEGTSVIIYDDINWSPDMRKGWNEISRQFRGGLILETYQFGIMIYDSGLQRQHHVINY
ncbi:O-methyltransferase [Reichenbachiella ulvae]|uniref:Methyltransferase domain-containing protein n=1 Tax=Reichenbachiella ulvae TaxID=2980104 RepID=A0ABT3CQR0_9BACT|nr:methyltransferase domain-containing protein [Reichenbachiella ulvae]MCV9386043.1 methyltransferase domain-containing protein [Reichenbachiella ulvae]